jgi:hypothetical protein
MMRIAIVLEVSERVLRLRLIRPPREQRLEQLLERAAEPAVEEHVPALLLPLVDEDDDGGDQQRLVRLHEPARTVEPEVLQAAAELVEVHRHRSTISLPGTRSTCGSLARIAHTALERWTRKSFSSSAFESVPCVRSRSQTSTMRRGREARGR